MQQGKNRVVLDTNIVVSAAISIDGTPAKIFEMLLGDEIINYATLEIIDEIKRVMDRPFFKEHLNDEYKKFILDNFQLHSVIIQPKFSENAVVEDEADNKFINCALTANADIISGDKHLKKLKSYKGVNIYDARTFLDKALKIE